MNRTQKKCFIASTGIHLLLLVALLFGPGFLSPHEKPDSADLLTFVTINTIDDKASNPGAASAQQQNSAPTQPPPPQQPPTPPEQPTVSLPPLPQPKPEPQKISEPEPPKNLKPNPEALEADKPPKTKPKPQISTTLVTRNQNDVRRNAEKQAAQAAAAEQQRIARLFGTAKSSLKGGLSGSTEIKFTDGVGGGSGPAYANWLSTVQTIYYSNWDVPAGTSEDLETTASVTIARDGTILTSRIIRRSGNAAMDKSVQATLDHVRSVSPFPANSKDEQRELNIVFKPLKQLLG